MKIPLLDGSTARASAYDVQPITDAEFAALRHLIYETAGIHLSESKPALVSARLARRVRSLGYHTFSEYHDHLRSHDPGGVELREMINCITTNKTSFFREPHHFTFLRERVLEPFAEEARARPDSSLRIWSAGCSSGEEPYTIAMTCREAVQGMAIQNVRILASDINTEVLMKAAAGVYPAALADDVPPELRRRHLMRGTGASAGYVRVRPELQALVAFRRINLTGPLWPIRTRFDAIFCRNTMIYFDRATQATLVDRFADALKPGGFLVVGHSENLHGMDARFESMRGTVYRLKAH